MQKMGTSVKCDLCGGRDFQKVCKKDCFIFFESLGSMVFPSQVSG